MRLQALKYALAFTLGTLAMTMLHIFNGTLDNYKTMNTAVKACEAELPRHQTCEPVYTARVKGVKQ